MVNEFSTVLFIYTQPFKIFPFHCQFLLYTFVPWMQGLIRYQDLTDLPKCTRGTVSFKWSHVEHLQHHRIAIVLPLLLPHLTLFLIPGLFPFLSVIPAFSHTMHHFQITPALLDSGYPIPVFLVFLQFPFSHLFNYRAVCILPVINSSSSMRRHFN